MRIGITLTFLLLLVARLSFAQMPPEFYTDLAPQNFNTDFSQYHQNTAIFMGQLAELVYQEPEVMTQAIQQLNQQYPEANYRHKFLEHAPTSSQCMIFGNKNFIVVAFRGTQEKEDILVDAQLVGITGKLDASGRSEFPHLPVGHGGFRRSLMNLMSPGGADLFGELDDFIANVQETGKQKPAIYLTGHSLGAALSNMFVLPLKMRGYSYGGSYNFAPPLGIARGPAEKMLGDPSVHNVTYDLVNNMDYVTNMPPYSSKRMKHFGKFYRICSLKTGEPLIYRENEGAYKIGFFKRLTLRKVRVDKHHFLSSYLAGVKNPQNTQNQITTRSQGQEDCSCLYNRCK